MEAGTGIVGKAAPGSPDLGAARPRWGEKAIQGALFAAALISILTTIGILVALLRETIAFFGEVGIVDFITDGKWTPLFNPAQYGIGQLVNGTFLITGIAVLLAIPLGLGSALYLSEYASLRVRKIVKPVLEVLVGVPTILFGFFALTFISPELLKGFFGLEVATQNALAAALVMAIMIMPTIASISEDAMSAVPSGLREGAYGMGATRLRALSTRVVFPAALSGIVAAIVLGVSRAIGETMIVLIAGGGVPCWGVDPTKPCQTITAFIGAAGQGDLPQNSTDYKTIFAAGTTLFILTLIFNMVAIRFVRRYRQVYE